MKNFKDWVKVDDLMPLTDKPVITACEEWINGEKPVGRRPVISMNILHGYYVNEITMKPDFDKPAWDTDQFNNEFYQVKVIAWMDLPEEYDERNDYIPAREREVDMSEYKSINIWSPQYKRYKNEPTDDAENEDYVQTRIEEVEKYGKTKWK